MVCDVSAGDGKIANLILQCYRYSSSYFFGNKESRQKHAKELNKYVEGGGWGEGGEGERMSCNDEG